MDEFRIKKSSQSENGLEKITRTNLDVDKWYEIMNKLFYTNYAHMQF